MLRLFNNAPALYADGQPVAIFAASAAGWSKAVALALELSREIA